MPFLSVFWYSSAAAALCGFDFLALSSLFAFAYVIIPPKSEKPLKAIFAPLSAVALIKAKKEKRQVVKPAAVAYTVIRFKMSPR